MIGNHEATHRPSRLGLYAMPAFIALLALAMIGWWMIATRIADQVFDHWVQAEDRNGHHWTCADRAMAGFPFRIELSCGNLTLKTTKGRAFDASFGGMMAVAQTYEPRSWLVELKGPLSIAFNPGESFVVTWSLMRASVHVDDFKKPDRASWVADQLAVSHGSSSAFLQATHTELHVRKVPGEGSVPADLDVAAMFKGLVLVGLTNQAPIEGDFAAHLVHGGIFETSVDLVSLETWRTGNGKFLLDHVSLVQGATSLTLSGDLALDEAHRPVGRLEAGANNIGDLMKNIGPMNGMISGIEGQVKLPLLLQKGRMMMGPFKLADLPALY